MVAGPTPLDTADFIYVRRGSQGGPLADSYDGPSKLVDRGPKVFRLQLGARVDTVSRDRLKAHLGVMDPEVASPGHVAGLQGPELELLFRLDLRVGGPV